MQCGELGGRPALLISVNRCHHLTVCAPTRALAAQYSKAVTSAICSAAWVLRDWEGGEGGEAREEGGMGVNIRLECSCGSVPCHCTEYESPGLAEETRQAVLAAVTALVRVEKVCHTRRRLGGLHQRSNRLGTPLEEEEE